MDRIFLYALVGWFAANALATVAYVGRERKPLTPGAAVVSVAIYGVWIAYALLMTVR